MPKHPSPLYKTLMLQLEKAIDRCISVSRKHAGISSPTGSHFYASALFTLLTTRAISLRKLLPKLKPKNMSDLHWDFGSVCTLTRTLLENRLAFYYFGFEECSEEEWKCRWIIFCLHDAASRTRILSDVASSTLTPEEQKVYDENMGQLRVDLKANSFFTLLPIGDQRRFLQGKQAYISPLEEIAGRCGLELEQFRFFYGFMSQQVHTLPMSFFRMDEGNRGRGVHSELEEHYHKMCMSLAVDLLGAAAKEMELKFAPNV